MNELTGHTISTPDVRVGDIWQEQDPRQPRFVKVARIAGEHAYIYAVEKKPNGMWLCARGPNGKPAPERGAQLKRFNGKRSGYALHYRTDDLRLAQEDDR